MKTQERWRDEQDELNSAGRKSGQSPEEDSVRVSPKELYVFTSIGIVRQGKTS